MKTLKKLLWLLPLLLLAVVAHGSVESGGYNYFPAIKLTTTQGVSGARCAVSAGSGGSSLCLGAFPGNGNALYFGASTYDTTTYAVYGTSLDTAINAPASFGTLYLGLAGSVAFFVKPTYFAPFGDSGGDLGSASRRFQDGYFARTVTFSTASGTNAIALTTNGARADMGTGPSDYWYSDGTSILTPTGVSASALTTTVGAGSNAITIQNSSYIKMSNNSNRRFYYNGLTSLVMENLDINIPGGDTNGVSLNAGAAVYTATNYLALGAASSSLGTCNGSAAPAGRRGALQYDTSIGAWRYCDGTAWQAIAGGEHPVLEKFTHIYGPTAFEGTALSALTTGTTAATQTNAAAATLDTSSETTRFYVKLNTAAVANSTSSFIGGAETRRGYKPRFTAQVSTYSATSERIWIGLTNATLGSVDSSAAGHYAMFRFSTNAGDTNWQACTSDGTTASCTDTTDTPNQRGEVLEIDCRSGTSCDFFVDGVLKVSKTTNLPISTASTLKLQMSVEALAASARSLGINRAAIETN